MGKTRAPASRLSWRSVVVAGGQEVDPLVVDRVDQAVLLVDPARPVAGELAAQRLGLAWSFEGV